MASERQSEQSEKSLDSISLLSQAPSQNSLMEIGPSESHLLDVRTPELVYNIDEETRMGPEPASDVVAARPRDIAAKDKKGKKIVEAKLAAKEKTSASGTATGFSALSFIASQYAESDNSSPRSTDSPAAGQEDNGGTTLVIPPPSEGISGNSSEGFDTTSFNPKLAGPTQNPSAAPVVGLDKVGAGGDAPMQCEAVMKTEEAVDEKPAVDSGEELPGDVLTAIDQAQLKSGEPQGKETAVDQGGDVNSDVIDAVADREVKAEAVVDVDMEDADVKKSTVRPLVDEKVPEKEEPKDKPGAEAASITITTDATDHAEKVVGASTSIEVVQQKLFYLPEAGEEEGATSYVPELMDIEDDAQGEAETEDKTLTAHQIDSGKPGQSVTEKPQNQEPDSEPVKPLEVRPLPDTDSLMSEDSKLDVEATRMADGRPAANADHAVSDSTRPVPRLHSVVSGANIDASLLSDDSRLASNMDSVMSEDSKLMTLDSVLSSGQEESSTSFAIKVPSAVIPFGENANSSMPNLHMAMEGENSNFSFVDESSQSNSMFEKPSRPKRARRSSISDIQDSKLETDDGLQPFPAERVFEYQWPQDGGEWYMLQEQVSEYLGVLSFKRKYPDLTRRTCDKLEKDFLREKGVVTETQSDLGLTAIRSEEMYDLMMKDYPDKYHEYATLLHEREKQKISDKHKEYEVAQPKLEKSKMADYMKKAAKSAAEYNRHLLREKREERQAFFDLQTFMIQYPAGRYKKLSPEATKPSAYPVALIPGQFQDHYCSYTSDELRYFPLNTALYDPPKRMSNTLARPEGSSDSSDNEDKSGSSSDSTSSGSSDSETLGSTTAATKGSSVADSLPTPPTPSTPVDAAMAMLGKRLGKKGGKAAWAKTPGKSPGRPLKGKRRLETGGGERKEGAGMAGGAASFMSLISTAKPASPAPVKERTEDEEDKDKCRICKNAVLFLKYKRVETKMIKCSECGKIAHPTCLDLTDKMVQVVTTYPWQCMECKTCVECMDPYDEDKMLFCDRCDRGYHTFCVGLRCLPTGRWECRSCKGAPELQKSRRGRPIKPT